MADLRAILRKDAFVLLIYFGLIVILTIAERMIGATAIEKWAFNLGSSAYVFFVAKNHWVTNASDGNTRSILFFGTCILFVAVGVFLGVIVGVNLKFLLGSPI